MAQHKNLTGDDLHEPKGVESATVNQVYVADGSGSGSWLDPLSRVKTLNEYELSGTIADVSADNSSVYFPVPRNSELTELFFVLDGTLTGTDAVVSLYRDGVLLGQSLTLPTAGSGDGVKGIFTLSPSYSFTRGQVLTLKTNGASTNTVRCFFSAKFQAS